jgi:Asp/Glu/hydantoin racemase
MKRIALIHTVKSVLDSFEPHLRSALDEPVLIHNLLDDFLATDPAETGMFSPVNKERLANDIRNAQLTGADIIVVTCSTLTPVVAELRSTFKTTPIIAIDDAMCRLAVSYGPNVTMLATARSTVEPTRNKILAEARAAGVPIDLDVKISEEAILALRKGDVKRHDELVAALALTVKFQDVVVLAQASMAHLDVQVAKICGCPVLASPPSCIAEVKEVLRSMS